jgi:N-acetyl-D-muramate 6-phosphate phosphatase
MPLQISRIQAICFDVDGTLSDTDDVMVAQLAQLLFPFNFLFPGKDSLKVARGFVMESEGTANFVMGLTDRIGLDDEIFALKDWMVRLSKKKVQPFQIIHGVKEMLEILFQHYPLAVVSARDTASTMSFLEQFDLVPYFKTIVTDQTCEHTKPFPDPILYAAGRMGVQPQACLMVGDTSVDIHAGKAAGSQTIGVLCGFGEEAELRQLEPDMILSTTPELTQVLENDVETLQDP